MLISVFWREKRLEFIMGFSLFIVFEEMKNVFFFHQDSREQKNITNKLIMSIF